MNTSGLNQAMF
uniref:Uncharacterized protein n=1 Tax=Anguilla anguilla TaxID=7936 RepID=A0A0E9UD74_ANGAN